ncbi:Phosphohydrolase [Leptospira biflexa serovar Patoc strain 'Patoc 1 (Ames)']|uniref:Putative membrane-bound phosphoesterase putative membrane protein putative signal peptide n=1 Tax=Leptospira biflexa serovar Patoc (strain Patoc 1 / ATCC 23582 / Paris) TaxID=456481 RepID=B0SN10_LEPBP|nr:metallophosphoesterase [Leptospira biflexa]ABZ93565.1 Phosphohydrolase [Leptospira biflexa serovar Patoc strain 'Patoc 1 (Ames)']ABZ97197.1 Putative membrane-bound phosphoesterase; putative membrane protein; putative signal peptide [Leptospira biflexa serovar Patoc strain 'Patoc 1 (Paris)']
MKAFFLFLSVLTSLLGFIYYYSTFRLISGLSLNGPVVTLILVGIGALVLLVPLTYVFSRVSKREKTQTFFAYVTFTNFGFFSILFTLVLLMDVLRLVDFGIVSDYSKLLFSMLLRFGFPIDGVTEVKNFSMAFSTIVVATALSSLGFYNAHVRLRYKHVKVPGKNLHPDLQGFKIVQISDVHIGPTIKEKFLRRVVGKINLKSPDVVVITGDLVDGPAATLKQHLRPLADIKSKYGVFYVTGNHEYYSGVLSWLPEIERLGIRVLLNENQILKVGKANLLMAGVTDLTAGAMIKSHATDPKKAMLGGENCDYKILLAHQPNSIYEANKLGFDLQISGHTHGGQFFPGNILIYFAQKFVAGLHRYQNTNIYVSRGTGYWGPPFRLGAPSEVSVLELQLQD